MNETIEQKEQSLQSLGIRAVVALLSINAAFIIGILTVKKDTIATDIHLVQMQPSHVLHCLILSMALSVLLIFSTYCARWCGVQMDTKRESIWLVPKVFAQFIAALSAIIAYGLTFWAFILLSTYFYDDDLTMPYVLPALDYGLYGLHVAIILFNLFGWTVAALRPFHRWCVAITAICWGAIGYMVGNLGYCPLTDWHWQVKEQLGALELPNSFITYLLNQAGFTPAAENVDLWVGGVFVIIIIITLIMWYVDRTADSK